MKVQNVVHRKLKSLRTREDIHQKIIADLIETSLTTYNMKENGKREFTITEIQTIINYFDRSFQEIFF